METPAQPESQQPEANPQPGAGSPTEPAVPNPLSKSGEAPQKELKRIPLSQIRPSQQNPRKIIRQDMIDNRAASMAATGQTTPIKVRPIPKEEGSGQEFFEIVGGELRYRGALKNGNPDIEAYIVQIGAREAFKEAVKDNRINKPTWFEDYLAMEELIKTEVADENMELKDVAALFEVAPKMVSRAQRILKVLSEASRKLLLDNFQRGEETWQISENSLYRLVDLGDMADIDAALPVVLEGLMTESQVRQLVEKVKAGQKPGEVVLEAKPKAPKGKKVKGENQPAQGHQVATPVGEEALFKTEIPTSATAPIGTSPRDDSGLDSGNKGVSPLWKELEGISLVSRIKAKLKKGEALTSGDSLVLVALWVVRHFKAIGPLLLAGVLVGVGWNWLANQVRGRGGMRSSGIQETKVVPAPQAPAKPALPPAWRGRVQADSQEALHFTRVFYGTSYETRSQWEDYFKGILSDDYGQKFVDTYFPQAVIQGMDEEKITQSFEPSGPARLLRVDKLSDDFRVEGTVTTQKGAPPDQGVSSMPVALIVGFWHDGKVYKVEAQR